MNDDTDTTSEAAGLAAFSLAVATLEALHGIAALSREDCLTVINRAISSIGDEPEGQESVSLLEHIKNGPHFRPPARQS